ncbi:MAG: glucose-6-phosphate isomerase [Pirellulaceae bacterium]|nr:glucose-6-phosphate isomerase [Pirellulaceae bacterium]
MSGQIRFSYEGALFEPNGLNKDELQKLAPALEQVRKEILTSDIELLTNPQEIPPNKQPLDGAFLELPQKLLLEYQTLKEKSEIRQILAVAERLQNEVDAVVILGIGGSYMGAKTLFDAFLSPYHNELSRAERNGIPRIYFEGNNLDNDSASALLDRLGNDFSEGSPEKKWAVVVVSKSGGTLETAVAFRKFLSTLKKSCGQNRRLLSRLIVPVTGKSGKLYDLATSIRCEDKFEVPEGVGGRFSIFSAVGLLPAAVMGIDILSFLLGAVSTNEHFYSEKELDNQVLQYVAVQILCEQKNNQKIRVLSIWNKSLESFGFWYDQLLSESLGKDEQGATPLTVVNTRDLHSRAQQHQEGRRDKVITNLIIQKPQEGPLVVGDLSSNEDQLDEISGLTYPQLMQAAILGTNQAYRDDNRPTLDITLPEVSPAFLGQLFQYFMLTTVVEGRVLGLNPYGQPGVEKYKELMKKFLKRSNLTD